MPAKWLAAMLFIVPALLVAKQEEDLDLFEFLAMYEQKDEVFIDAEMDDKYEAAENINELNFTKQNFTKQNISKSESDE